MLGGAERHAGEQERWTYIKESLVTCILWGSHAGAGRHNHFYFSQINVAFTARVFPRVIVSELGPERQMDSEGK